MFNYFITLHSTDSEDIIGHVVPVKPMDIDKFDDILRVSWREYESQVSDDNYGIEDFVEFHNLIYEQKIDYVVGEFIQLS